MATRMASMARGLTLGSIGLALAATSIPVAAQDDAEARVRKLEQEVRALQRKVFPGGDGRYFEPQITGQPAPAPSTTMTPSTTAVTDILARLDALESQLQTLTSQYEVGANAMRLLEERVEALEGSRSPATTAPSGTAPVSRPVSGGGTTTSAPTPAPAPAPAAQPSPERVAAVQAIMKPQSGDPGEDEYNYGFRLWDAGFFPEAQQQLTLFVEQHGSHRLASYGRNLLGRAYLDDGKPNDAAPWFLRNYQSDKNGARAGDSLLYLAETMIAINDTSRACIALAEFGDTYPALAAGRLQSQYEANRAKVQCG